jgi:hypothetical protein
LVLVVLVQLRMVVKTFLVIIPFFQQSHQQAVAGVAQTAMQPAMVAQAVVVRCLAVLAQVQLIKALLVVRVLTLQPHTHQAAAVVRVLLVRLIKAADHQPGRVQVALEFKQTSTGQVLTTAVAVDQVLIVVHPLPQVRQVV